MVQSYLNNELLFSIRNQIRIFHWRYRLRHAEAFFARHACLGADVLKILNPNLTSINIQKGRIDYLLECWNNSDVRARTKHVYKHLKRFDILGCVLQEEILFDWAGNRKPKFLFMDSMAELADQSFLFKNSKWQFLSSYSDINHTSEFNLLFDSLGLLPIDKLENKFKTFFSCIRNQFGNIPIFYLHFPSKLECREKFICRAKKIKEIVDSLATNDPLFFSLSVDTDIVDWDENRTKEMWDFAYHYNSATYEKFAESILATGHWPVKYPKNYIQQPQR